MKSDLTDITHNISFIIIDEKSERDNPRLGDIAVEELLQKQQKPLQKNFVRSFIEYIFICPRGRGNYSIRFYETLRAGRNSVMVDSDQVFL